MQQSDTEPDQTHQLCSDHLWVNSQLTLLQTFTSSHCAVENDLANSAGIIVVEQSRDEPFYSSRCYCCTHEMHQAHSNKDQPPDGTDGTRSFCPKQGQL